jgi:putative ABC transport system substrate-binding protein
MRDLGWINGRNVQIEIRFAGSDPDLIKKHVRETIKLTPDVIVADSIPIMATLHPATNTIPIVFVVVSNPVGQGYISNLARPGRNITGFSFIEPEIIGDWISLLGDVNPSLSRVILMFNPDTAPYYDAYLQAFKAMPQQPSVEVNTVHVRSIAETDSVIAKAGRRDTQRSDRSGRRIHCSCARSNIEICKPAQGTCHFPIQTIRC